MTTENYSKTGDMRQELASRKGVVPTVPPRAF
ncbi:hypothetical protein P3T32_004968 [Ralstonia sp. GP73]|jgi:hypothetical protein|uniref:Uncharacterized protein n=1 Tax=Ralstonia thomasii TaxID=3058596 RepID=A0AAD2BTE9_9RALS|nr:hypothetical protein [Ralstonia sp. GP73]CAJ0717789.1 hypothetical protein LMG7143_04182 [Ralstonia sp. LMG 18095]CAJ0805686.1 hypothetical protein R77560_04293 [Ralstonia sp. LMG 18095]CAJ0807248.1 hypothetical protein LMG18095_04570 [Ralstonia sp. LMG 18095]CAJ0894512.1 hypothetical protein R6138_03810 [Ralstonia sp. LMG 18095]